MDSNSITLIVSLCVLLFLSAFFSSTETAFSSLNRIRLKNSADQGNKRAILTLNLYEKYDNLLSTILIGNNLVNILAASLSTVLFVKYYGNAGVTISTVVLTVVVLIFGEITPKSLAKEYPESYAMKAAPFIKTIMFIFTPFNYVFGLWKKMILKLLKKDKNQGITEGELLTMVDEAQQDGGIEEHEGELIHSVLEFNDVDADDILTPRVDIVAVSLEDSKRQINKEFNESRFSRLPVYDENIDDIVGFIHYMDFVVHVLRGDKTIQDIMKPCVFVMPSMKIYRILKMLQKSRSHIAVVTDEFGGTEGIVTMEDILEELVGEIWDEHDEVVTELKKIGDNKYRIICSANLEDMFEFFSITGESDSTTVSGWVVEQLDKIPSEGDTFEYEDLLVVVSKIDSRRVLEIIVEVKEKTEIEEE